MKTPILVTILIIFTAFNYSCDSSGGTINDAFTSKTNGKKKLILAIDGGGIKGILPGYFLTLLEAGLDSTKSYQIFDVIGGTSTGGIMSLGLTTPFNADKSPRTAEQLLDFYLNDCSSIFYKNQQYYTKYHFVRYGPAYFADSTGYGVEPYLRSKFTDSLTLKDAAYALPNKKVKQVFTTTYLVNSTGANIAEPKMGEDFGPYLYNWMDAIRDSSDNYFLWEAARSTSAAPTYFPIAHLGGAKKKVKGGRSTAREKWAIDGGVMSNDPAIWAVAECLRAGIATSLDDIIVISVGCGYEKEEAGFGMTNMPANTMKGQKYGFWGTSGWIDTSAYNLASEPIGTAPALSSMSYANQFVPATQLELLAQGSELEYYRVQFDLPRAITPMDACSNVDTLHSFAKHYFQDSTGKAELAEIIKVVKANI